jgi:hypothetical protein
MVLTLSHDIYIYHVKLVANCGWIDVVVTQKGGSRQ